MPPFHIPGPGGPKHDGPPKGPPRDHDEHHGHCKPRKPKHCKPHHHKPKRKKHCR
jgi:hypothetical protein